MGAAESPDDGALFVALTAAPLALVAADAEFLLVAEVIGNGSTGVAAPHWQAAPVDRYGIQFAVWAPGRLWIGNWGGNGAARLVSARVTGGRLTGWVSTQVSLGSFASMGSFVLGDYLVYSNTGSGGPPDVKGVRLLPTGKVSALGDLGGAPASQSSGATQMAQLPDRVVRRAAINVDGRQHEAGCCDVNGKLVDWNSFLPYGAFANFGIDRHGRLWLAWYVPRRPAATMVELDTSTLQPRGKPATAPGPAYKIDEMVCAERCRLAIEGNWGSRKTGASHFWSWAPGERSVTQINAPRDYSPSQCRGSSAPATSAATSSSSSRHRTRTAGP